MVIVESRVRPMRESRGGLLMSEILGLQRKLCCSRREVCVLPLPAIGGCNVCIFHRVFLVRYAGGVMGNLF